MGQNIVIIPTYNEKENIEAIIRKVFSLDMEFDILIVDDGSPDGTADIVKGIQNAYPNRLFILEREGKLGLGTAYIAGFHFCGMTPKFIRERLFRPFDSTKGSQSMGIGAYQAREYIRELGGQLTVSSEIGEGTCFSLSLPIKPEQG